MILDLAPEIVAALEANQDLVALLGGKRVYRIRAPNAQEFPRITFFEMTNFDSSYADDKPIASELHYQIDIWTKGSYSQIVSEVDKSLQAIGFIRSATGPELFEEPEMVYHKPLRYKITQSLKEE